MVVGGAEQQAGGRPMVVGGEEAGAVDSTWSGGAGGELEEDASLGPLEGG